jgi:hypothetical protein
MNSATRDNTKRKRPDQAGTLVGVRLQPEQLAKVDEWRERQDDTPTRPEAIRRLVEKAL